MNTVYVIKRDVDVDGKPVNEQWSLWAGRNGGGWVSCGACGYATHKLAAAAIKRNAKSGSYRMSFLRCNPYIIEVDVALVCVNVINK